MKILQFYPRLANAQCSTFSDVIRWDNCFIFVSDVRCNFVYTRVASLPVTLFEIKLSRQFLRLFATDEEKREFYKFSCFDV